MSLFILLAVEEVITLVVNSFRHIVSIMYYNTVGFFILFVCFLLKLIHIQK